MQVLFTVLCCERSVLVICFWNRYTERVLFLYSLIVSSTVLFNAWNALGTRYEDAFLEYETTLHPTIL